MLIKTSLWLNRDNRARLLNWRPRKVPSTCGSTDRKKTPKFDIKSNVYE